MLRTLQPGKFSENFMQNFLANHFIFQNVVILYKVSLSDLSLLFCVS